MAAARAARYGRCGCAWPGSFPPSPRRAPARRGTTPPTPDRCIRQHQMTVQMGRAGRDRIASRVASTWTGKSSGSCGDGSVRSTGAGSGWSISASHLSATTCARPRSSTAGWCLRRHCDLASWPPHSRPRCPDPEGRVGPLPGRPGMRDRGSSWVEWRMIPSSSSAPARPAASGVCLAQVGNGGSPRSTRAVGSSPRPTSSKVTARAVTPGSPLGNPLRARPAPGVAVPAGAGRLRLGLVDIWDIEPDASSHRSSQGRGPPGAVARRDGAADIAEPATTRDQVHEDRPHGGG